MADEKNQDDIFLSPELDRLADEFAKDPESRKFLPLAEEYRKSQLFEEAIYLCKEGLKKFPDYLPAKICLAKCYLETNEDEDALLLMLEAQEKNPDNLLILKVLGDIYNKTEQEVKARYIYEKILELQPDNRTASERIKKLDQGPDDLEGSLEMSLDEKPIAEAPPDNPTEESVDLDLDLDDEGEEDLDLDIEVDADEESGIEISMSTDVQEMDIVGREKETTEEIDEILGVDDEEKESEIEDTPDEQELASEDETSIFEDEEEVQTFELDTESDVDQEKLMEEASDIIGLEEGASNEIDIEDTILDVGGEKSAEAIEVDLEIKEVTEAEDQTVLELDDLPDSMDESDDLANIAVEDDATDELVLTDDEDLTEAEAKDLDLEREDVEESEDEAVLELDDLSDSMENSDDLADIAEEDDATDELVLTEEEESVETELFEDSVEEGIEVEEIKVDDGDDAIDEDEEHIEEDEFANFDMMTSSDEEDLLSLDSLSPEQLDFDNLAVTENEESESESVAPTASTNAELSSAVEIVDLENVSEDELADLEEEEFQLEAAHILKQGSTSEEPSFGTPATEEVSDEVFDLPEDETESEDSEEVVLEEVLTDGEEVAEVISLEDIKSDDDGSSLETDDEVVIEDVIDDEDKGFLLTEEEEAGAGGSLEELLEDDEEVTFDEVQISEELDEEEPVFIGEQTFEEEEPLEASSIEDEDNLAAAVDSEEELGDDEQEELIPVTISMAKVYEDQGHLDKAKDIYKKLLERNPQDDDARSRLAALQSKTSPEPIDSKDQVATLEEWLSNIKSYNDVAVSEEDQVASIGDILARFEKRIKEFKGALLVGKDGFTVDNYKMTDKNMDSVIIEFLGQIRKMDMLLDDHQYGKTDFLITTSTDNNYFFYKVNPNYFLFLATEKTAGLSQCKFELERAARALKNELS